MKNEHPNAQGSNVIYYDFMSESHALAILGGAAIIKGPLTLKIINVICLVIVVILFIYTIVTSVITIAIAYDQKAVMGQAIFALGTCMVAVGISSVRHLSAKDLNLIVKLLKEGVYIYGEELDVEYFNIKKKRVDEINMMISICMKMFFACGLAYVALFPLLKYLLVRDDVSKAKVNPYLPIPLYVPFDTSEPLVFWLSFMANEICLVCMYAALGTQLQVYIGCALQLTAEYEVLNFSLENTEKRASLILKQDDAPLNTFVPTSHLYSRHEFQDILVSCLKRNIMHHQAILRFKIGVSGFMEKCNTVGMLLFSILMAGAIIIVLEDVKRNITLTLVFMSTLFGYFPLCWFGELITNVSSQTVNSFYSTPWVHCNEKFKVILGIAITNSFKPVILRARGIHMNISLETFGELMSAGYKAINLLH